MARTLGSRSDSQRPGSGSGCRQPLGLKAAQGLRRQQAVKGRGEVGPVIPTEMDCAQVRNRHGLRMPLPWGWGFSDQHRPLELQEAMSLRISPHRQQQGMEIRLNHHQLPPCRQILQRLLQQRVLAGDQEVEAPALGLPEPRQADRAETLGQLAGHHKPEQAASASHSTAASRWRFIASSTAGLGGASR